MLCFAALVHTKHDLIVLCYTVCYVGRGVVSKLLRLYFISLSAGVWRDTACTHFPARVLRGMDWRVS